MVEHEIYKDVERFWRQQAALYGSTFHIESIPKAGVAPSAVEGISLERIEQEIQQCTACKLSSARQGIVPGRGNPKARVVCISSEPPSGNAVLDAEQDDLLDKILAAIGFGRDEVYVTSLLKCQPVAAGDVEAMAFSACSDHLFDQLKAIGPRLILALGERAIQILSGRTDSLESYRGKEHRFHDIITFATYHPTELMANASLKRGAWKDVQLLRSKYDELVGDKPPLA